MINLADMRISDNNQHWLPVLEYMTPPPNLYRTCGKYSVVVLKNLIAIYAPQRDIFNIFPAKERVIVLSRTL